MPRKLLFIAVDQLDWLLLERFSKEKFLPNLTHWIETGTRAPLAALFPRVDAMLWTHAMTSKRSRTHGIAGESFIDGEVRLPVSSKHLRAMPLWDILSAHGVHASSVNFPATHPARELSGVQLSDAFHVCPGDPEEEPMVDDCISPTRFEERFRPLRLVHDDLDASIIDSLVLGYDPSEENHAQLGAAISTALCEAYAVQAATLEILDREPWAFVACRFRLFAQLASGLLALMDARDGPKKAFAGTLPRLHALFDLLLGELRKRAGEDAEVLLVSDQGVGGLGHKIPAREGGFLVATGPGFDSADLPAASLLDLAPTVLQHFGLPRGLDMEGGAIPGLVRGGIPDPVETHEDGPGEQPHPISETDDPEWLWNRARDTASADHWSEAPSDLIKLSAAHPANIPVQSLLANTLLSLGQAEEAARLLDDVARISKEDPELLFALARVHAEIGNDDRAFDYAQSAVGLFANPTPFDLMRFGYVAEVSGHPAEAEDAFTEALATDAQLAGAHAGMSRIHFKQRKYAEAADAALEAIEADPRTTSAHLQLGEALKMMNLHKEAEQAMRTALVLDPDFLEALEKLRGLYRDVLPSPEKLAETESRLEAVRAAREAGWKKHASDFQKLYEELAATPDHFKEVNEDDLFS